MDRSPPFLWWSLRLVLWLGLGLLWLDLSIPAHAQATYSISGSVRRDADGDGDPTDFDTPMAGVVIRLHSDPNGDGNPADGIILATTATDLDGWYHFSDLIDGHYVVEQIDPPGAVSTYDPVGSPTDSLAAVTIAGADVSDIDFLDFGVFLFALSGTAYADGPLLDADFGPDDIPVAAIIMHLHADLNGNGLADAEDPLLGMTVTGTDGRYGFGGLVQGNYVVVQIDPPGAISVNDRHGAPNDNQVGVTILNTDVTNADFLDQNLDLAALRGTVRLDLAGNGVPNPANPPLAGVLLLLFTDPDGDGNPFDGNAVALTATNLQGEYAFPNLPSGHYVVFQFDPQGATSTWDATGHPGDSMVSAHLSGSDIEALDFMDAGALTGIASGIVYEDGANQDGEFTPDDTPVAGVTVRLYADLDGDGLPSSLDVWMGDAVSRVGGAFSFSGLVYGMYVAEELAPDGVAVVNALDGDPGAAAIGFEQSGSAFQNLLFLNQGLQPANLAGSVRNDLNGDGNPADPDPPLPNVPVRLFTDPNGDGDPADGLQLARTVTNAQGGWQFPGVAVGNYVLVADEVAGSSPTYDTQGSLTDGRVALALSGANLSGLDFLKTGALLASISGTVYADGPANDTQFSGDDVPLPAVFVRLFADVNQNGLVDVEDILISTTATNLSGDYVFSGLPSGSYLVFQLDPPGAHSLRDTQGNPTDNTVAVTLAGTHIYGVNFLDGGVVFSSISGLVMDDADENGILSAPDRPLPGATVRLYIDLAPEGTLNAEDMLLAETATNASGQFVFPGLVGGTYLLQQLDRPGATRNGDSQGPNDGLTGVQLATTDDTSSWFVNLFDPTGYLYDAVTGAIVPGGQVNLSGPGAVSLLIDGSSGQYEFVTDGTPGTYTLSLTPPPGYKPAPLRPAQPGALDPTGMPDPYAVGAGENPAAPGALSDSSALANPYHLTFNLAPGDPRVINNNLPVVRVDAPTFAYWSAATPGAGGSATANLDGDSHPDLLEYVFHTDAQHGVITTPRYGVDYHSGSGKFRAFYRLREQGLQDVTVKVKVLADLANSPAGWTNAAGALSSTSNGDGSATFILADLEAEAGFSGLEQGFVRFEVALDADQNGTPETVLHTETHGWQRRTLPAEIVSWSSRFARPGASLSLEGVITSVSGSTLNLSQALGGQSLFPGSLAETDFVEILDGPHAGHRLPAQLAGSSGTTFGVNLSSARCTLASLPGTLTGARFVLRSCPTLASSFPPSTFNATNNPSTADRAMVYDTATQNFTTYWLFTGGGSPRWVREGDATLASQNNLPIDPARGALIHRRTAPMTLATTGPVRSTPFVFKLGAGQTFLGNPWPLPASPNSRSMTVAAGFTGTAQPSTSDLVSVWRGDFTPGGTGYDTYFLLKTGALERWVRQGDATLQNRGGDALFKSGRAAFVRLQSPMPQYQLPAPWVP